MMLERPRGPSPWAPAPMARESFRTAASFDVDVDADDRLRRETPVPVRCCGCCFTRAKVKGTWCCMAHTAAACSSCSPRPVPVPTARLSLGAAQAERLAEAAISQVEGLDVEVFELTRGTVKRIKRAATGKGGLDAVLKRTLSGVGDGSGLELSRGVLPGTFVPVYVTSGSSHHAILASGSKSLMGLSLYDFGVYADVAQVRDSQLADQYRRKGIGRPPAAMHEDILARGDFGMTVCLGVARTVRASLIQGMYRGIFERRTVKAGGSTDDPGLRQIVDVFSPDKMALVPGAMDGGSVRQGTVVSFTRSRDRERLKVCVNGRHLDTIDSRAVTQALFDMYVGTQPTSEEAQQAAWRALVSDGGTAGSRECVVHTPCMTAPMKVPAPPLAVPHYAPEARGDAPPALPAVGLQLAGHGPGGGGDVTRRRLC